MIPTPRMPVMSPLPHRLPLASFSAVTVAVTGFKEAQKAVIKLLVENLGGRFMANFKVAECSHLMVPTLVGANEATLKKVGTIGGGGGVPGGANCTTPSPSQHQCNCHSCHASLAPTLNLAKSDVALRTALHSVLHSALHSFAAFAWCMVKGIVFIGHR